MRAKAAAPWDQSPQAPLGDLNQFVHHITGKEPSRVEETLGDGYVRLGVQEAERRQAAHDIRWVEDGVVELLRNARDAQATHIYVASTKTGEIRRIVVVDDGAGIPPALHERVFEARVTSKLDHLVSDSWGIHGRGMALFSLRQRAKEARVVASGPGLGTSIAVAFETEHLKERKDQSSWPHLVKSKGTWELRGPNNIARACAECVMDKSTPTGLHIFLGSPAEIVATLRAHAKASRGGKELLFAHDISGLSLAQRLLVAPDASQLADEAHKLGLCISERTAHRILEGAIAPLCSVASHLRRQSSTRARVPLDLAKDPRKLKLTPKDSAELAHRLAHAFEPLSQRYFIDLVETPHIRVQNGAIVATFHVKNQEEG